MFDTVRLKATEVSIKEEILESIALNNSKGTQVTDLANMQTGELYKCYKINHDEKLPFIKYTATRCTLEIQVSIPKFLYGENITMVTQEDVRRFFSLLQDKLFAMFGVLIRHDEWIVLRVDVCNNFYLDNVSDCMRILSKMKYPRKNTILFNHDETVSFKNDSSEIIFYDKEKESKNQAAQGIMRMEIRPSREELKKHSTKRKAIELLTKDFFVKQTKLVLSNIKLSQGLELEAINIEWLSSSSIGNIERAFAFTCFQNIVDESALKRLYGYSTYRNRVELVKATQPPTKKEVKLLINYDIVG